MLGMIMSSLSSVAAVAFPVVASYKALAANDMTLMRPWLMYWVILGVGATVESFLSPVLRFVPFYSTARFFVVLWLIMPGSQGAVSLYNGHVEPWLKHHDEQIDGTLAAASKYVKQYGLDQLARLTGAEPGPEGAGAAAGAHTNEPATADSLLGRFRLPVPAGYDIASLVSAWRAPQSPEELASQRSQLLALVASLDRLRNDKDNDGFDVIDSPQSGASATPPAKKGWLW